LNLKRSIFKALPGARNTGIELEAVVAKTIPPLRPSWHSCVWWS